MGSPPAAPFRALLTGRWWGQGQLCAAPFPFISNGGSMIPTRCLCFFLFILLILGWISSLLHQQAGAVWNQHAATISLIYPPITRGYLFPAVSTNAAWNQHATSISLRLPPWSRGVFSACSIDKWGATWNWRPPRFLSLTLQWGVCFFCILVSVH